MGGVLIGGSQEQDAIKMNPKLRFIRIRGPADMDRKVTEIVTRTRAELREV